MNLREQVDVFDRRVQEFEKCIASAPPESFLIPLEDDEWSARDILAHLIGWNRYTIQGYEQIRRGDLPFYYVNPGQDFGKVNTTLVRAYPARDRQALLDELQASWQELKEYLLGLDPADWERDFGVRYKEFAITIQNSAEALADDYRHHRAQIEDWLARV
jgi:hypothetical protein